MGKENFLIYGANGFTGRLILKEAVRRGLKPIIAGRNADEILELAKMYNLESQIFSLDEKSKLKVTLNEVKAVLHCAGPFRQTTLPVIDACLETGTHYLDITGEMKVFEWLYALNGQAQQRNVMLLPGCGFDVVPTDCIANFLKTHMPGASHLKIAFKSSATPSRGTLKTMISHIHEGSFIRRNGEIVRIGLGELVWPLKIKGRAYKAVAIPWGDLNTAWYSTGIPNIEVYLAVNDWQRILMRISNPLSPMLKEELVKEILKFFIDQRAEGPSPEEQRTRSNFIAAKISDQQGHTAKAFMVTPEGYTATAQAAVHLVRKVLEGNFKAGFQTPSTAYGYTLAEELGWKISMSKGI